MTNEVIASQRLLSSVTTETIEFFKSNDVNCVINLQMPFEHQKCGPCAVDARTGFSYDPQRFMDEASTHDLHLKPLVYCYMLGWQDMSCPTLERMLDIAQIMAQTVVVDGKKVLVHCHAGLGRTGLAIACFIVYRDKTVSAETVISMVRTKRPGALQTEEQVKFVRLFHASLITIRKLFKPTTWSEFMRNQSNLLLGDDKIRFNNIFFINLGQRCNQIDI